MEDTGLRRAEPLKRWPFAVLCLAIAAGSAILTLVGVLVWARLIPIWIALIVFIVALAVLWRRRSQQDRVR